MWLDWQSIFVSVIGAFGFFNVQKTLFLQILTGIVRWTGKATFRIDALNITLMFDNIRNFSTTSFYCDDCISLYTASQHT